MFDSLLDTLDPHLLQKLWDYLLGIRRDERKSIIILTSSSKIAETCGRIAVIHNGSIVYSGRPDDFRRLAGEDMIVLGDIANPMLRNRIQDRLSVVIQEEDGFLSFRVANGERMITDLLAEFGQELGCVYLKRPTLDDALNILYGDSPIVTSAVAGNQDQ
jgi:ABC-type multidrug transport system ATPase subunit